MGVKLIFNNDTLLLPVSPSSYEVSNSNNNTKININAVGDINLLGKRGLYSISLSSFFPNQNYYFCETSDLLTPNAYVNKIKGWFENNNILQLIIEDINLNMQCSISDFTYTKQDETGDIYFTISLVEYRKVVQTLTSIVLGVSRINNTNTNTRQTTSQTYVVKKGDCLSTIAKRLTGNSANWRAIYSDNRGVVGGNPNLIYPGQTLTIRASY